LLYDPTGQPSGGSEHNYQTLGVLMYQQGWTNDRLGLASATAWTMFVLILVAVGLNAALARRRMKRDGGTVIPVVHVTPTAQEVR
jgi:cellobiose transport system permease protein